MSLGELILKILVQFFSHLSFNFNSLPVQKWPLCMYCIALQQENFILSLFDDSLCSFFLLCFVISKCSFRFFMLFLHCTVSKTIAHFIIMVQFLQCDMYVWQASCMKYNKKHKRKTSGLFELVQNPCGVLRFWLVLGRLEKLELMYFLLFLMCLMCLHYILDQALLMMFLNGLKQNDKLLWVNPRLSQPKFMWVILLHNM